MPYELPHGTTLTAVVGEIMEPIVLHVTGDDAEVGRKYLARIAGAAIGESEVPIELIEDFIDAAGVAVLKFAFPEAFTEHGEATVTFDHVDTGEEVAEEIVVTVNEAAAENENEDEEAVVNTDTDGGGEEAADQETDSPWDVELDSEGPVHFRWRQRDNPSAPGNRTAAESTTGSSWWQTGTAMGLLMLAVPVVFVGTLTMCMTDWKDPPTVVKVEEIKVEPIKLQVEVTLKYETKDKKGDKATVKVK